MTAGPDDSLARILADEAAKARKLEIIFGQWWRHYAVPYEFPATLYFERSICPYCGGSLGAHALLASSVTGEDQTAHLDHMDPLSRGGEDSIRNAAYVCSACNAAKGSQSFVNWLNRLDAKYQAYARQLYLDKHGHMPEETHQGTKQPRLRLLRPELSFDESVLRKLFPKPIVSGPPVRN